jgi:MFS family permease
MTAALFPFTLLAPFAGVFADRWNRRRVIIVADVVRGLVTSGVAYLAWTDALSMPLLVGATALISVASCFFHPAIMASLPNMVGKEELPKAVALMETGRSISRVLGPAVGGLLVGALGFPTAFLINGLSFLISALSEFFIYIPQATREKTLTVMEDLREGALFLAKDKLLVGLIVCVAVMNFFEPPVMPVVMPIVAEDVLMVGTTGYGYMRAVVGLGGLIALIALASMKSKGKRHPLLLASLAAVGLTFLFLSLNPNYLLTLMLLLGYGLFVGVANTLLIVLFAGYVPDTMRGKIIGLASTLAAAMIPVSFMAAGVAADLVSIGPILKVSGLAIVISAVFLRRVHGMTEL